MFEVRYAPEAEDDLLRLFDHLVARIETADQRDVAVTAIAAIRSAIESLSRHSFPCRKHDQDPLLREPLIPFGSSGHVALYRILDDSRVLILASRQQLADDHH